MGKKPFLLPLFCFLLAITLTACGGGGGGGKKPGSNTLINGVVPSADGLAAFTRDLATGVQTAEGLQGFSFLPFGESTQLQQQSGLATVANQALLVYSASTSALRAASDAKALGAQLAGHSSGGRVYSLLFPAGKTPDLRQVSAQKAYSLATNPVLQTMGEEGAETVRDAQALNTLRDQVRLPLAQGQVQGRVPRQIRIAVLDTGMDLNHESLRGLTIRQTSLVDQSKNGENHGTMVGMAIMGRPTATFTGGVASTAELFSLRVCAKGQCPLSAIIAGLEAAAAYGPDIVYLGFGARDIPPVEKLALQTALNGLIGAVVLAPAGNTGQSIGEMVPATLDGVVPVAAVDKNGNAWSGNNVGSSPFLAAPGVDMEFGFSPISGTSFAGAAATGALAWLSSYSSPQEALGTLLKTPSRGSVRPVDLNLAIRELSFNSEAGGFLPTLALQAPDRVGVGAGFSVRLLGSFSGPVSWTISSGTVKTISEGEARVVAPSTEGVFKVSATTPSGKRELSIEAKKVTPQTLTLLGPSRLSVQEGAWAQALADTQEGYRIPVAGVFAGTGGISVTPEGRVLGIQAPGGTLTVKVGGLTANQLVVVGGAAPGIFTPQGPEDWPFLKGNETRTGVKSGVDITGSLAVRWRQTLGSPVTASPVVQDGVVYVVPENGRVRAYQVAGGTQVWQGNVAGNPIVATPAVCGNLLLILSTNRLVALDRATGTQVWAFPPGATMTSAVNLSSPVCDDQRIFFGSGDRNIYALDLNGGLLWSLDTGGQVHSSPALVGTAVAIGSANNHVYLLDGATGTPLWDVDPGPAVFDGFKAPQPGNFMVNTTIANNTVYTGWFQDVSGFDPALLVGGDPDILDQFSGQGKLYAIHQASGTQKWEFSTDNFVISGPSVEGNRIYFGDLSGNVYAINDNGGAATQVWKRQLPSAVVNSTPIVVGNLVFIGSDDKSLYALDKATGAIRGSFETGGRVWSSIATTNNLIMLGSGDGTLYALGASFNPSTLFSLQAFGESGQIRLNWNAADFVNYADGTPLPDTGRTEIFRANNPNGPFSQIASIELGTGTYIDLSMSIGITHSYYIRVTDGITPPTRTPDSNIASAKANSATDQMAPSPPTQLTAQGQNNAVFLAWLAPTKDGDGVANLSDLAGYRIYRSPSSGGPFVPLSDSVITATSFLDTTAINNTTYFYVVRAVDNKTPANESVNSNEASATPRLDAPDACQDWLQFGCTADKRGFSQTPLLPPLVKRWEFQTGAVVGSSPVALAGNVVFAGSEDRFAYAIDTTNGRQVWRFPTAGILQAAPVVNNSLVVFASEDRNVYGLDRQTGTQRWKKAIAGPVFGPLALANDTIYFGDFQGFVYGKNIANGEDKFQPVRLDGPVLGGASVVGGVLYIGSADGKFYALNTTDGSQVWPPLELGANITSTPSVDGNRVYVGNDLGTVFGIDRDTGEEIWRFQTQGLITASPAVRENILYIGSADENMYAIDGVTGIEVNRFASGAAIQSTGAIAGNILYFGNAGGDFIGLDLSAFPTEVFRENLEARILASPAISNGFLAIASDAGRIFGFGRGDRPNPPTLTGAQAGDKSVTLSWSAPLTNTDGTVLTDLGGYKIYYGTNPEGPFTLGLQTPAESSSANIPGLLNDVVYFFKMTTIDEDIPPNESDFSNVMNATPANARPLAPQNVVAEPGDKEVTISWSAVTTNEDGSPLTDLRGYTVYFTTQTGGPYSAFNQTPTLSDSLKVTGLVNGQEYFFVVTSIDNNLPLPLESVNSEEVSATPIATIPNAPENLQAQAGDTYAILSWSPVVTNTNDTTITDLRGYNIFIATQAGGPYSKSNSTPVTTLTFLAGGLTNGTTYFAVVQAIDRDAPPQESEFSNEVSFTPASTTPGPPTNLTATAQDSAVFLEWRTPETDDQGLPLRDLMGYNLYFSLSTGGPYTLLNPAPLNSNTYLATGLQNLVPHFFVVRAVDNEQPPKESVDSNEATATPNVQTANFLQGEWFVTQRQDAIPPAGRAAISLSPGATAIFQNKIFDDVGIMLMPHSMYNDQGVISFNIDGRDAGILDLANFEPDSEFVKTFWIAKNLTIAEPFPQISAKPDGGLSASVTDTVSQFTVQAADKLVVLQWPKTGEEDVYDVIRSEAEDGPISKIANDMTGTFLRDTNVVNGRTYFYRVMVSTKHRVTMTVVSGRVGFIGWETKAQDVRREFDVGSHITNRRN